MDYPAIGFSGWGQLPAGLTSSTCIHRALLSKDSIYNKKMVVFVAFYPIVMLKGVHATSTRCQMWGLKTVNKSSCLQYRTSQKSCAQFPSVIVLFLRASLPLGILMHVLVNNKIYPCPVWKNDLLNFSTLSPTYL